MTTEKNRYLRILDDKIVKKLVKCCFSCCFGHFCVKIEKTRKYIGVSKMESHLVRIINRLELMATDGGNLKRNFEREGVVVAEVSFSNDPENGPVFTLRDVEARESYSFDSIDLIAMEIYDLLY